MRAKNVRNALALLLLEHGQLTVKSLQAMLRTSNTGVNYALERLADLKMLTQAKQLNEVGRLGMHYGLTSKGIAAALRWEAAAETAAAAATDLTLTGETI